MKTLLETSTGRSAAARVSIFVFLCLIGAGAAVKAAQLTEARVTQIIKEVKLLGAQGVQRPAAVSDDVRDGTAVRTGTDSRAELTFTDLTITRLGANTIFSFNAGARELDLGGGAALVQVPRNAPAVKITTAAVTAAISGGTALVESNKGLPTKLLLLEGIGHFYPKGRPDEAVTLNGGEMVMMTADGRITQPTKFNVALVLKTSKLVAGFAPLPNADLISAVIEQQQAYQPNGPSNPPPSKTSTNTIDTISNASTASTATGGSAKFGPLSTITSPNPYHITSGTQINTDPTITTNGVTNSGKLYRGLALDGPLSTWLGSSPTSFDTAFGDNFQPDPNKDKLPIAGFLFSGLQLDGNPTISNPNGAGILGLASQNGITSSPSGAVFTFSGIERVGLIALDGSIDLSGISFANFKELFVYARGSGGNVIWAAPVSNLNKVQLHAVGNVQVNAPITTSDQIKSRVGNNFQTGSTLTSNQISIQSLGSITLTNSAQLLAILGSVGRQIVMQATGSDTSINIAGTVHADQGLVDIRHEGLAGAINLNNADVHADVMIVAALGNNGALNIGSGNTLSADTAIRLYAAGSNGTLNFLSSVTLTSPSNILAANTINISNGAIVTISNLSNTKADVFTNNPNYSGFGGNGTTSGTFSGAGANNPQPLANAPALPVAPTP